MINKPQAVNRVLAKRRIGNLCTQKGLKVKLNKLKKRKKSQRKFFNKYLETQKEQLSCLICQKISIKPTLLSCGHLFCFQCINEFIQKSPFCPECSTYIFKRKLKKCRNVENLLKVYFRNSKDEEECEERLKTEEESSDYLDRLRIKKPKIGMKIDVRDTGCVWCVGEITKVIWNEEEDEFGGASGHRNSGKRKRVPYVKVHYLGWDSLYDEYLKSDSSRIRPLGYYTSKQDMPRYANVSSDSNLLYSYIEDGRAISRRQNMQEEQESFIQANQNPQETLLRRLIDQMRVILNNNELEDRETPH